ncbi:glycosyl transferase family protein [Dorcoceras hygrometricum]|uniref:Glycosyl transferase family protein n=1 Tax=Dorcoceras hygrometricum TaxID=472368 RepID=A0A2Z7BV00_9LAMI|nr:glycosyl transferase family protein [Dorcoceras hygrometricum]
MIMLIAVYSSSTRTSLLNSTSTDLSKALQIAAYTIHLSLGSTITELKTIELKSVKAFQYQLRNLNFKTSQPTELERAEELSGLASRKCSSNTATSRSLFNINSGHLTGINRKSNSKGAQRHQSCVRVDAQLANLWHMDSDLVIYRTTLVQIVDMMAIMKHI